ncbi:tetratricopeptide repeat protein [Pseudomonas sp. UBA2684]|uniref:tetratricopeptide repeat protein n=1 Tax=Pseudomonas sp. UBA2684 TaxID=1947311 RepID=UPI000E7FA1C1|nr:tetratricopeptide repeat protein [Pseudomonas sp. UBA2684]HBX56576.1 Tfp pilus assembly protein PilF [Pseudomonas sp.]|tara:strand:- start:28968 stop:29996 length:1029 start_codon:yes stop_codon:yes gene_type:complete
MKRISLLLAMTAVLSGCQTMGPEPELNTRSVYSGDNSLLHKVQKQASSADQAMQMAAMAYRAGDLDQSLYQYLRAIELQSKRYEALVGVGRIHRERGNTQLAEMAFSDVLASQPENLDALAEMGLLQLAKRDHEVARALLFKAVALDQRRLGNDQGDGLPDVAALKVDGQSPLKVYNALGVLADLSNDFPLSEAYYRLALLIEPRSVLVQNSLGYSYYLAGQWPEAERTYQRGIGYDTTYAPLWRNYGLLLARMERYEEALSAFEQISDRAQASNDVGYVCLVEGKLDVAEQFFRSAIEQSPAHYDTAWENLNRVQQVRRIRQMDRNPGSVAVAPLAEPVAQ